MALSALGSLSPARRRLAHVLIRLVALLAVAGTVAAVVTRDDPVDPVPQDQPGPVLLVPGYGGSTTALQVLRDSLTADGRDVRIVTPTGSGTQDLRDQATDLGAEVDTVLKETGAPSVDLVGYSAGGVVVRIYVADLGGGSHVRRVITLASPHHGTDLAALGGSLGSTVCPAACSQLDPDSELLRRLNAADETPAGPTWIALWTEDDETVVPPDSGSLKGALAIRLQSVCPGLVVAHRDVPRTPAVIAIVTEVLSRDTPTEPSQSVCS